MVNSLTPGVWHVGMKSQWAGWMFLTFISLGRSTLENFLNKYFETQRGLGVRDKLELKIGSGTSSYVSLGESTPTLITRRNHNT